MNIQTAKTTTEIETVVNQILNDCGITGHESESYGETADRLESDNEYGSATQEQKEIAQILRQAEARWEELEG